LIFIFFIPGFIRASGQYKILSWKGEVRVKQGDTFVPLTKQAKISLRKSDVLWLANGAAVELLFPGGFKKSFKGPRLTRIETLEKNGAKAGPSFLADFIKITGIEELFSREMEDPAGATKGDDFAGSLSFYEEIKKTMKKVEPELKDMPLPGNKEKQMNEKLAFVNSHFDAAPPAKQILMKARIYKHFKRNRQALMAVFNHYEKILKARGKQKGRELLEDSLFNEFLPIVVTIHSSFSFSANFKLWWAAFSYDGKEFKEIEKTIDYSLHPQDSFKLNEADFYNEKDKIQWVFIVACSDWDELEKLNDTGTARKELLGNKIKEAKSKTIRDYGRVIIKLCLRRGGGGGLV
jgi:hypothetical protein